MFKYLTFFYWCAQSWNKEGCDQWLFPEDVGDDGWEKEGKHREECEVVPVLEHDQLVLAQVCHADGPPSWDNTGMFPHTEPAQVGEEESSL